MTGFGLLVVSLVVSLYGIQVLYSFGKNDITIACHLLFDNYEIREVSKITSSGNLKIASSMVFVREKNV